MKQIELEIRKKHNAFDIPAGVKKATVKQTGDKIVVEMVQEEKPNPGDVMINKYGNVYIFKRAIDAYRHEHYAWFGKDGGIENIVFTGWCISGRPATSEEAQSLWDALKKAGKQWNAETMQVEEIPEVKRIHEWVESHWKAGYYSQDLLGAVIFCYLEDREGEK